MNKLRRLVLRVPGRQAQPAPFRWNMAKTLIQMLGMWAVFLGLFPRLAFAIEDRSAMRRTRFGSSLSRKTGSAMFIGGWALAQSSAVVLVREGNGTPLPLDLPRRLVINGPYGHVRNPMAIGSLFQGLAVGVYLGSPLVIAYSIAGAVIWNEIARPWEEEQLRRSFGASYRDYRRAVRCWIPRFTAYAPGDSTQPVAPYRCVT